jgi:predicted O-methyltransferase YrrM
LCEEVFYNNASFYDFEKLGKTRQELLDDPRVLNIQDHGAGSRTFKGDERRICDIAASGISSRKQSELLYKLVNFLRPGTIVELGTSLGLTTLYLAKANLNGKVISIEGSNALHAFASDLLLKQELNNITLVHGKFDEQLPGVLTSINTLDFFYVDGNHTYDATMNYFKMGLEKKTNDSVFVFDDIYWSEGMTRAWKEIKEHPEVMLSIDAFYFGLIFFKEEVKEKVDLKVWL